MSEHAIGQYRFKSAQACMSEVNASDITLGYRELDATRMMPNQQNFETLRSHARKPLI